MLKHHFVKVLLGIILIVSVTCQSARYFNRHCSRDRSGRLRTCKLFVTKRLDFNDFRRWTLKLEKNVKVSLDVTCGSTGTFFLPWPMRANGLINLKVSDCTIDGFMSEFNNMTGLKDEMQEYVIENCVLNSNIHEVLDTLQRPGTKEYDCGQQTVHSVVKRNMSYAFPNFLPDFNLPMSVGDTIIQKENQKRYRCRYPNLEYIDQSISRSRSKFNLRLMTAYSDYPKLKKFLMADNGYSQIPEELVNWQTSFPQLEYLDMSKNNIINFNSLRTQFNQKIVRTKPLVVDLSFNSIQQIPHDINDYLTGMVPIIVDLTGNPFRCGCNFMRYKRYITEVVKLFPRFNRLFRTKCYSTKYGRKLTMRNYIGGNCLF